MKKHVKVISSFFLLSLLAAGLLFAGGGQEKKTEVSATGAEKVKVVFWTHGRHDLPLRTEQVERFNATNKDNVFVVLESHADKMNTELNLAFESGQAPAIFTGKFSKDAFTEMGRVADLRPLLKPEVIKRYESMFVVGKNVRLGKLITIPGGFGHTYRMV
ncbi:MAG: hypothetical protein AB1798_08205, partial [Spirochaetota bacterium]